MRLWRPRSLIARILLAEILIILLAGVLLWRMTATLLQGAVDRYQDQALAGQAVAVASAVRVDGRGGWRVELPASLRPIYETGYDGRAFAIVDASGGALAVSPFSQPDSWRAAPRLAGRTSFHRGRIRGVSQPFAIGGRPIWVMVTLNERGPGAILDDVARLFLVRYVGILLILFLLLTVANGLAIRRLVRAVRLVSRRAAEIETRTLHRRLDEAGLPSEIVPLVHAANTLLDRLEASFRLQSEFSGNVAHELRTPLATLRAQLDGLEDQEIRGRTIAQADRLSHILSQLRELAALELPKEGAHAPVDLAALAVKVIAEMAPRAIARGQDIAFEEGEGPVAVVGNAVLIELAIVNLVGNAIVHTPAGTTISVSALAPGDLIVADDGPGISAADAELITRRFWRADQSRSDGAGLGLSIVRRIMDVHGGSLEVLSARQGARFRLRFPQRTDPAGQEMQPTRLRA